MGAGASKPGDSAKQVFTSENPIQFSQELIDSLQASSETNSTRAKSLELHIQQRVAQELEAIQKEQASRLAEAQKRITAELDPSSSSSSSSSSSKSSSSSSSSSKSSSRLLDLPSISPTELFHRETEEEKQRKSVSSKKVQEELDRLGKMLGDRKVLRDIPDEVSRARDDVVKCLRRNDRQSLNCWREVEIFKREVRRMEGDFVRQML